MAKQIDTATLRELINLVPTESIDAIIAEAAAQLAAGEKIKGPLKDILSGAAKARAKAATTVVGIEQKLRAELEKMNVRSGIAVTQAELLAPAKARGEVAATEIRAAPAKAGLEHTRDLIEQHIDRPQGFDVERTRATIAALPTETHPEHVFTQQNLHEQLETKVSERQAKTRGTLHHLRITDSSAVEAAEKFTAETAQALPRKLQEASTPEAARALRTTVDLQGRASARTDFLARAAEPLEKAGLRLTPEGAMQRLNEPLLGKQAGLPAAESQFQALLSQATGGTGKGLQVGKAAGGIKGALGAAGKGLSKFRGKAAGAAGILTLLPILSKMFGGGQQQGLPPALQIQMLQEAAQAQQGQQTAQSLSASREASAAKNLAQADLLRLQMLQLTGGAGPAVV